MIVPAFIMIVPAFMVPDNRVFPYVADRQSMKKRKKKSLVLRRGFGTLRANRIRR